MGFNSMPDPEGPFSLQDFSAAGAASGGIATPIAAVPSAMSKIQGDSQTGLTNTQFGLALKVQVLDQFGNPVFGDIVTFSMIPGGSGASATFVNGLSVYQAATDANGFAISQLFTANATAGSFAVEAVEQSAGKGVTFAATSNPPIVAPTAPTAVTGSETTSIQASVSFTPGDNGGAVITSYTCEVRQGGVLVATVTGLVATGATQQTVTISNSQLPTGVTFVPGSVYTFDLAAVNRIGASPFSAQSAGITWNTHQAPVVTSVTVTGSTVLSTSAQTSITIAGTGFTGATAVTINGVAAFSFVVNSDTQISAVVSAAAATVAGVDVIVTTSFGPSQASPADTVFFGPQVQSISGGPLSTTVSTAGVIITGVGFTGATAVKVGATNASSFTVNSDTQITATFAAIAAGIYDITVTTPQGTSGTRGSDQISSVSTSTTPVINSVVNNADQTNDFNTAGGDSLIINGSGFTGATAVVIGAVNNPTFTVNSDTKITVTTAAHGAGTYHVKVTNGAGNSNTPAPADLCSFGPVVGAAGVNGCNPSNGFTGGGSQCVITGQFFTGATAVNFGANPATNVVVNSDTQITCTIPGGVAGVVDVTVVTPKGTSQIRSVDQFTYQSAPTRSFERLLYINQAAGTVLQPSDVAGYEFVSIQPTQVSGYTNAKNGAPSIAGAPAMGTPSDHYNPATGAGNTLRGWMSPVGSGRPPGKVVTYINSLRETSFQNPGGTPSSFWGPTYNPVSGIAGKYYLCTSSGAKIIKGAGPLMIPVTDIVGHTAGTWALFLQQTALAVGNDPVNIWDGIFWDVDSTFSWDATGIDPNRGGAYTYANFTTDLGWFSKNIFNPAFANFNQVFNCVQSATDYFGKNAQKVPSSTVYHANGVSGPPFCGMAESFLRAAGLALRNGAGALQLPTLNDANGYAATINMIDDITRVRGCAYQGLLKFWVTASAANQDQWARLGAACILLGYQGYGTAGMQFSTAPLKGADTTNYPMMDISIGNPSSLAGPGTIDANGVYSRQFQSGFVYLNTDTVPHVATVALPAGTYTDVGPKVPYTPASDYPAASYPNNPLGGAVYAGLSTPTIPPNNALILRNY